MKGLRQKLTYANVMSSIAVFLVLGGAAVAATQLPKNSVGTKQLRKNAVTTAKLKKNAVTGAKIKPDAVTGAQINEGTLAKVPAAASADSAFSAKTAETASTATSADSAKTAASAANAANADHLDGLDATDFLSSAVHVRIHSVSVPASGVTRTEVMCQPEETLVGGGGRLFPSISSDVMLYSSPIRSNGEPVLLESQQATGWEVRARNGDSDDPETLYVHAICVG